jgi:cyclase
VIRRTRVIPCLLLRDGGLVKTLKFTDAKYVGDPINAVRIFNDKEVDEMAFLDVGATSRGAGPNFALLADIASEAFMPFAYGGGVTTPNEASRLFLLGVEKVILNSALVEKPTLVSEIARIAGNSSVVVAIDARRNFLGGYSVWTRSATHDLRRDPVEYAQEMEQRGAGEILLTSIDRDGTQSGYDLELVRRVASAVSIPVIACGGAGALEHFREAVSEGASAVAAGSLFVFHGKHRAVLITYPDAAALSQLFAS